jgi:DNA-binding beta-propeller fold protein YncE
MTMSNDGLVYLCNRSGHQVHVYDRLGNFKTAVAIPWKAYTPVEPGNAKRRSGAAGAAVSVALSRDREQRFLFVNNQNNSQIEVLDRKTLKILSSFGRAGHLPGQFDQPLNIAVDSKDNVYVTENRGKRVQRFGRVG